MMDRFESLRVEIRAKRADSNRPNYDEEWEIHWKDDLTLRLDKQIEKKPVFPYSGKPVQADPQEFAALLRELADEIEILAALEKDAQVEFDERAAILEHDGDMSQEQAEAAADADVWGGEVEERGRPEMAKERMERIIGSARQMASDIAIDGRPFINCVRDIKKHKAWEHYPGFKNGPKTWERFCREVIGAEPGYVDAMQGAIEALERAGRLR